MNPKETLFAAFQSDTFRKQGQLIVDLLSDYLHQAASGGIREVLPPIDPNGMLSRWKGEFRPHATDQLDDIVQRVLNDSIHIHHPHYVGHQVSAPLPMAILADFVGTFLNQSSAVYEMGPVNVAMEKRVVEWMCDLIGYGPESDGVMTSGGTAGNLTGLLAARQAKAEYDIWSKGAGKGRPMAALVSEQSHYSVRRALAVMGLGEEAVISVPVDSGFHMDVDAMAVKYQDAVSAGKHVFAVVANGCTTATGTYDDLEAIADFAEAHDLWFHVDGAHGASALLSEKYKHLLKGVERVDSIAWDAHKMMMMPALTTAVLFKNGEASYESFSQDASYLFEKKAQDEWYNYAHRTMECTKMFMGIRLYLSLSVIGTQIFSDYVTSMYDLTREFADILQNADDFELAHEPESNILCFRHVKSDVKDLNAYQKNLRQKILSDASFYIVQTELNGELFLRCTIINPLTTIDHLKSLMEAIRKASA